MIDNVTRREERAQRATLAPPTNARPFKIRRNDPPGTVFMVLRSRLGFTTVVADGIDDHAEALASIATYRNEDRRLDPESDATFFVEGRAPLLTNRGCGCRMCSDEIPMDATDDDPRKRAPEEREGLTDEDMRAGSRS